MLQSFSLPPHARVRSGSILVHNGYLHTETLIACDSREWFTWLEEHTSFTFIGENGYFTAQKETRSAGGQYWRAYRRNGKKLRRTYLGRSQAVSLATLEQAAAILAN